MFARWRAQAESYAAGGNSKTADVSDRRLVERTLAGDQDAFALLHRRHYAAVYRMAIFRTRSVADAEDIAAETWVRAVAHLSSYRFQGQTLLPWLLRIAANLIADRGRKKGAAVVLSLDNAGNGEEGALGAYLDSLASDGPDPYTLAEQAETQAYLRAAIAKLPPDQAEVTLLRFGNDLPLKEIAQHLNRSEGAIKSLIHRALVNLRRELQTSENEAIQFAARRAATGAVQTGTAIQPAVSSREQDIARRFHDL